MKSIRARLGGVVYFGLFIAAVFLNTPAVHAASPEQTSASDLAWLKRISWGANAADYQQLQKLGRSAYLAQQLKPAEWHPGGPVGAVVGQLNLAKPSCDAFIQSRELLRSTSNKIDNPNERVKATRVLSKDSYDIYQDGAFRSVLYAVYSPNQLQEMMTWFWFNHFNVYQGTAALRASVACYEHEAIRPHALGKFRDLLEATLRHPAMLWYLNNDKNAVKRINENYARELVELHTLSVDAGYTQQDVQELAKILTGAGVNIRPAEPGKSYPSGYIRDGLFEFNPVRHDFSNKQFLGRTIQGRGYDEIREVLDILSTHPATATFISKKLANYFVSDSPSDKLVGDMASVFLKTDGDIPAVLNFLFSTEEFNQSLGKKLRNPYQYWVGLLRLLPPDVAINQRAAVMKPLENMGQALFGMTTPDGYSLMSAAWQGSGQLAARFDAAKLVGQQYSRLLMSPRDVAKSGVEINLNNHYYQNVLQPTLNPATLQVLAKAKNQRQWNSLLLSAPEMMYR